MSGSSLLIAFLMEDSTVHINRVRPLPSSPAGSSSSGSSSDDEVKEAFESTASSHSLWPGHTHPWPRPIRVPPTGCRKKAPKYFAQMSSAGTIERPRLDFNKMQYSKRFVMVSALCSLSPPHTLHHPSSTHTSAPPPPHMPHPLHGPQVHRPMVLRHHYSRVHSTQVRLCSEIGRAHV